MLYQPIDSSEPSLTSPTAALSHIKPGDRIFVGTGCVEPRLLLLHLSNMEYQIYGVLVILFSLF